jgi:hypothetical protein
VKVADLVGLLGELLAPLHARVEVLLRVGAGHRRQQGQDRERTHPASIDPSATTG